MNKIQLEERLISFSVSIIEMTQSLPETRANNHLGMQLLRSATSTALNYGEAQSGESRRDFIHKIKLVLKELRESHVCLKIIFKISQGSDAGKLPLLLKECDELVVIFVKSVQTAENKQVALKFLYYFFKIQKSPIFLQILHKSKISNQQS
ncbi:MAG: four helix bundle protein [Bacteroidetes bacterium]|nr:MAG: four helix bundle protein [Bacteroidota bacterium]